MAPKPIEMIGKKLGRLTVVREADPSPDDPQKHRRFTVRCECGNEKNVLGYALRNGNTISCGCLRREIAPSRSKTPNHGDAGNGRRSSEHNTWQAMIARCEIPHIESYKWYGARGIKICKRWRESYADFLADMGRKPSPT